MHPGSHREWSDKVSGRSSECRDRQRNCYQHQGSSHMVHTYIHKYIHTYIHIHTCIHTYTHTYMWPNPDLTWPDQAELHILVRAYVSQSPGVWPDLRWRVHRAQVRTEIFVYVRMYVRVYAYMYVCVYVCMYVKCMYVRLHLCTLVWKCIWRPTRSLLCMYVCMYVQHMQCLFLCVCMYVCMYVCTVCIDECSHLDTVNWNNS